MSMVPIVDICKKITSGGTPSRSHPEYYGGDIPWIKTGELKSWYIKSTEEQITEEAIRKSSAKIYPINTVLMAMYGDGRTIGSVGITGIEAASNQACCALITDPDQCDPLFLFYSLQYHRKEIVSLALGASQRNLNQSAIKNFKIRYPKIEEQREISSVLSQFDFLIENNQRRIRILEDMAQSLYREWFVHFRFPGHKKIKLIDSPLGPIPQGWKCCELGELVETPRRAVDPSDISSDMPYIGLEHIPRKQMTLDAWGKPENVTSTKLRFFANEIIFGKIRPYFHKVVIAPFEGVSSSDAIIIKAIKAEHLQLVFQTVFSEAFVDHATQTSNGTKMPRANWDVLEKYSVPIPDEQTLEAFNSAVSEWISLANVLMKRNHNLARTRDLLLPKLISGEVALSAAPSELEEAA